MASSGFAVYMYVNEPPEDPWVYIDHAVQPRSRKYRLFKLKGSSTRLVWFRALTLLPRRGRAK